MSIKKKMGAALVSTALGAALIGGGTFALFTSTDSNTGNTFTAGTVSIDADNDAVFASTDVTFNNMAPGDSGEKTITVTNKGTLDAWVAIDEITTTGLAGSPNIFAEGGLKLTKDSKIVKVAANGGTATFTVDYEFPSSAGNNFQGAKGTAEIKFKAVQARNNGNDTNNNGVIDDGETAPSWN
jgi:spore coat-associated protein N